MLLGCTFSYIQPRSSLVIFLTYSAMKWSLEAATATWSNFTIYFWEFWIKLVPQRYSPFFRASPSILEWTTASWLEVTLFQWGRRVWRPCIKYLTGHRLQGEGEENIVRFVLCWRVKYLIFSFTSVLQAFALCWRSGRFSTEAKSGKNVLFLLEHRIPTYARQLCLTLP